MSVRRFLSVVSAVAVLSSVTAEEKAGPGINELQGGGMKHQTAHKLHVENRPITTFLEKVPGELSGDIGFFGQNFNNLDGGSVDDFATLYFAPHYTLDFGNGLKLEMGGIFNKELKERGGYDAIIADDSVLSEMNFSYTFSETTLKLGRQSLEFILLEDFFDGVAIESSEIDGLTLRFAWVNKAATLDPDDLSKFEEEYFATKEDTDGLYALEADYELVEEVTVSAAYASANGLYRQYGGRVVWEQTFGDVENTLTVESFSVDNYGEGEDDGRLFHINDTVAIGKFSVGAGYISTGEKAGVGGLLNNFYDAFNEDSIEDYLNVNAWYVTTEYAFTDATTLGMTYGQKRADFDDEGDMVYGETVTEFDLVLTHGFTDNISSEFAFVNIDSEKADSWSRFYANVVYRF